MFSLLLIFYPRTKSFSLHLFKSMIKSLIWVVYLFPCIPAHFFYISCYNFIDFVHGTLILVFRKSCFKQIFFKDFFNVEHF